MSALAFALVALALVGPVPALTAGGASPVCGKIATCGCIPPALSTRTTTRSPAAAVQAQEPIAAVPVAAAGETFAGALHPFSAFVVLRSTHPAARLVVPPVISTALPLHASMVNPRSVM